jgi:hypothetical protein
MNCRWEFGVVDEGRKRRAGSDIKSIEQFRRAALGQSPVPFKPATPGERLFIPKYL